MTEAGCAGSGGGGEADCCLWAVLLCCRSLAGAWKAESQPAQKAAEQSAQSTAAGSLSHTLHRATELGAAAAATVLSARRVWLCLAAGLWS